MATSAPFFDLDPQIWGALPPESREPLSRRVLPLALSSSAATHGTFRMALAKSIADYLGKVTRGSMGLPGNAKNDLDTATLLIERKDAIDSKFV
jgi:hypothetical protein